MPCPAACGCPSSTRRMMCRASQGFLWAAAGGNASRAQTALPVAPESFHPHPSDPGLISATRPELLFIYGEDIPRSAM